MQSCFNVVRKRNPREAVRNLPRPDDHYDGDDDDDDDDVGDDGEYDDRDIDEDDWRWSNGDIHNEKNPNILEKPF